MKGNKNITTFSSFYYLQLCIEQVIKVHNLTTIMFFGGKLAYEKIAWFDIQIAADILLYLAFLKQ